MAKEYISRDAAIKARKRSCKRNCAECDFAIEGDSWCEGEVFVVDLLRIPAADVVEVRHANWIEDGYYDEPCVCSNCGEPCKDTVMGKPRWNYCPNCGAKMDGGQDDV